MSDERPIVFFDVSITPVGNALRVTGASAKDGEVCADGGKLPTWTGQADVVAYGQALFRAVFPERVRSLLDRSRGSAHRARERLCIRLKFWDDDAAAWLLGVPWELLMDPSIPEFLALDQDVFLVRHLQQLRPPAGSLRVEHPNALIAVGDAIRLDWQTEVREVERTVRDAGGTPHVLPGATRERLANALQRIRPDVFHFIGHGAPATLDEAGGSVLQGCIRLPLSPAHDVPGNDSLGAEELARMLQLGAVPDLVFLNSCSGAEMRPWDQPLMNCVATRLVLAGIPTVLAMTRPVGDSNAVQFASFFYRQVALGGNYLEALAAARLAAQLHPDPSNHFAVPALFTRADLAASPRHEQNKYATRVEVREMCGGDVEVAGAIDRTGGSAGPLPRANVEVHAERIAGDSISIAGTIVGKR